MAELMKMDRPKGKEREKKPTWTMDVMILSNLNQIAQYVDDNATRSEQGDLNSLLGWRAGLKQFYRNLKSFITNPEVEQLIDDAFGEVDKLIDPINRTLPNGSELRKTFQLLDFLTFVLFHLRNDLFMRFIEMMSPVEKSMRYSLGALPPALLDKKVEDALGVDKDASKGT